MDNRLAEAFGQRRTFLRWNLENELGLWKKVAPTLLILSTTTI
jgi:hypothetical protein